MRYFNLMLSPAEVEAYTADYLEEVSPRADVARMLLRIVSMTARITTEMEELKRSHNSPSIWKLHADSLVVLIDLSTKLSESAGSATMLAGDGGPQGKGGATAPIRWPRSCRRREHTVTGTSSTSIPSCGSPPETGVCCAMGLFWRIMGQSPAG
jgi:hypothetical protein